MNKTGYYVSRSGAILLLVALFVIGCKSPQKIADATLKKFQYKSEPEVLEVRGDSIAIKVTGKVPAKVFPKNALVKFQPILRYNDGKDELPLKPIYLKGEKVKDYPDAQVINSKSGGSFSYSDKVEYQPAMKKSTMLLDVNVKLKKKYSELDQCTSSKKDSAMQGTITTALTVKPTDDILFYQNDQVAGNTRTVIFYYVINEGKLRDSVMKGPAIRKFRDFMADTKTQYKSITFRSYASPDGEMSLNANLTKQRAESSSQLVSKELKRMKVTSVNDNAFLKQPDPGSEDWEGLRRLVSESNIDGKTDVLNVINSNMSVDEKEAALRKLPSWKTLTKDILPRLRRTEVILSGSVPNRDLNALNNLPEDQWNTMSQTEMMMLTKNTKDSVKLGKIYSAYARQWPNDVAGQNNSAAWMLKQGNYKAADSLFTMLVNKYPNNDTLWNNLGVAKRFERKYDTARTLYTNAQSRGIPENNNLGILNIKYGFYDKSEQSFESNRCDYNSALAYTLNGDYDQALSRIDCIPDKTAWDFYLRAIVGARKGDKDLMTTSLTRAVQMDPSFRDMAKGDLEFRKYKDTPEFKQAIGGQ